MSRYELRGREPHLSIVVGWDRPLWTFFAQVWDDRRQGAGEENGEEPILWVGCFGGEVPTVEALAENLEPFVDLPADIREQLVADRSRELTRVG